MTLCGVPWRTTKPPNVTLHRAGGKMIPAIQVDSGQRSLGLQEEVPR